MIADGAVRSNGVIDNGPFLDLYIEFFTLLDIFKNDMILGYAERNNKTDKSVQGSAFCGEESQSMPEDGLGGKDGLVPILDAPDDQLLVPGNTD